MRHKVTLSFDNGPSHRVTPWVLDVLRERSVRSTFFVVGELSYGFRARPRSRDAPPPKDTGSATTR